MAEVQISWNKRWPGDALSEGTPRRTVGLNRGLPRSRAPMNSGNANGSDSSATYQWRAVAESYYPGAGYSQPTADQERGPHWAMPIILHLVKNSRHCTPHAS
jgi:hypothetical protein